MLHKKTLALALFLSGYFGVTQAYIDPGTGSYIIQLLIAGAVGAGYGIKMYWYQIKGFFGSRRNKSETVKNDKKGS